ncbi:MAG: hypothetical protein FJX52_00020 [Alphaproteobacteria bacterium]|nr:hypothetical protein [Alphaproteobacteria bacterium]
MVEIARAAIPQAVAPDTMIDGATARIGADLITDPTQLATAATAVETLLAETALDRYDGVIIAAFGDPAVANLKQCLPIPVTGIAEAGMAAAATAGRKFSVVTTTPALADEIRAAAARYGRGGQLISIRATSGDPASVTNDARSLVEALALACIEAIERDYADAIIIGGGPLAAAARALAPRFAVPIIEPVPAAVRLALARIQSRLLPR